MGIEQLIKNEAEGGEIISLTEEEFKRIYNLDPKNPEDIKFIESKGIALDSGDVVIKVNGRKEMMVTDKDDFGTILTLDTIERRYGKDKRREFEEQ